jgi:hypothetical protein
MEQMGRNERRVKIRMMYQSYFQPDTRSESLQKNADFAPRNMLKEEDIPS